MSGVPAMGGPGRAAVPAAAAATGERAKVRALAHQLEGVFLNQLFQAMRESVPQGGAIGEAPGQEMFTQVFDERIADAAATRMRRGIGEALYRQLAARLPAEDPPEAK